MTTHHYLVHGLHVVSDLAMPGTPEVVAAASAPDVRLRLDPPAAQTTDLAATGRVMAGERHRDGGLFSALLETGEGYLLHLPGIADIRLERSLAEARVVPAPSADPELLPVLATGHLMASLLLLRGHLVLHASAVERDGVALALVGHSAAGKSTLATLLCRAGWRALTDDVLRADVDTASVVAHRGATESRLRPHASDIGIGMAMRATADGRAAVALPVSARTTAPLAAVLLPRARRDIREVGVHRLAPAEALLALSGLPRVAGWTDPVTLERQFHITGDLVEAVPVARLDVPWGPPFPADLAQTVAAALAL